MLGQSTAGRVAVHRTHASWRNLWRTVSYGRDATLLQERTVRCFSLQEVKKCKINME